MVLSGQVSDEESEEETPLSNVAFFSPERRARREAVRKEKFGR